MCKDVLRRAVCVYATRHSHPSGREQMNWSVTRHVTPGVRGCCAVLRHWIGRQQRHAVDKYLDFPHLFFVARLDTTSTASSPASVQTTTMGGIDLEQPLVPDLNETLAEEYDWPESGPSKMPAAPNLYPKAVAAMTGAMATSLLSE